MPTKPTTPIPIQIREATDADLPAVVALQVECWRSTYRGIVDDAFLDSMTVEKQLAFIRQIRHEHPPTLFLALSASDPLGFAVCGPERTHHPDYQGELLALYVLDSYQKRGIGRRLMLAAVEYLLADGMASMLVWSLTANQPARDFYQHWGGKQVATSTLDIDGKTYNQVGYGWRDLKPLATALNNSPA